MLLTAMTFAIRARLETVFGPSGMGLTLEDIGYAFMPAFWGFTLAMIFGGSLVDLIGMKRGMWLAFVFHAIGIGLTLIAFDFICISPIVTWPSPPKAILLPTLTPKIVVLLTVNGSINLNFSWLT